MEKTDYKKILEKVNDYLDRKPYIIKEIIDENEKTSLLTNILGNHFNKKLTLGNFLNYIIDDINIFLYETYDMEKNKNSATFLVVKENMPILRIDYLENEKNNIIYREESYTTYFENTNLLLDKININTFITPSFKKEDLSIYTNIHDDTKYSKNKYEIYYNENDEIISFKCNSCMYLNGDIAYIQKLDNMLKMIKKSYQRIDSVIDSLLEIDNVKVYEIKKRKSNKNI